jgi:signal transduction histidine kinase
MTSLRLEADSLSDPVEREAVLGQVDRLEGAIDALITAARTKGAEIGTSRLDQVVAERVAFWSVLAEEQDRALEVDIEPGIEVDVPPGQLEDALDILIDNVFSHTEPGTALRVAAGAIGGRPFLRVEDRGQGMPDTRVIDRGASGDGSTGLGLDIARRTAEMAGGGLELSGRPGGGARVTLWFGATR